jgi:hypothetical protein
MMDAPFVSVECVDLSAILGLCLGELPISCNLLEPNARSNVALAKVTENHTPLSDPQSSQLSSCKQNYQQQLKFEYSGDDYHSDNSLPD